MLQLEIDNVSVLGDFSSAPLPVPRALDIHLTAYRAVYRARTCERINTHRRFLTARAAKIHWSQDRSICCLA